MLNEYLAPFATSTCRPQRRLAPDVESPRKRRDRIRWIGLILADVVSVKEAAGANDVNRRTILNWHNSLLADDRHDTDHLRDLAAARELRRSRRSQAVGTSG